MIRFLMAESWANDQRNHALLRIGNIRVKLWERTLAAKNSKILFLS